MESVSKTHVKREAELTARVKELMTENERLKSVFDLHTKAVNTFLNDLYCTMIDPLDDNVRDVKATCDALLKQAREDRESLSRLDAAREEAMRLRETLTDIRRHAENPPWGIVRQRLYKMIDAVLVRLY